MAIRVFFAIAAAAFAIPGVAQTPSDWDSASAVEVTLSSFAFTPEKITLQAGVPVKLILRDEKGGHSFSAPGFFGSATVEPEDQGKIKNGKVELKGGETVAIRLIPSAGTYKLTCTHFMHSAFGMKGIIVVE